ncbi:hypothetical protein AN958_03656 [Leucoagaricus sp. SymC.cos]|nr:hypothetical protein AN958_03656 [Leucoagaricus sp. SymC.cos]
MEAPTNGDTLAAPFIGFTTGTALFGITLTQAYHYFARYPNDSLSCKIKVSAAWYVRYQTWLLAFLDARRRCSLLDLLHFVFSAALMYTFLISKFGIAQAATKNMWSLKALGTTQVRDEYLSLGLSRFTDIGGIHQAVLIVLVQIIYLRRIVTFSSIPAFNGEVFSRAVQVAVGLVGCAAAAVGIAFCYELQKLDAILSLTGNTEWVVYMGFGATAAIDIIITGMMCFVLYKNRADIGVSYMSRQSDRLFRSLITYALATGIITTGASLLVIILYIARPNSLFYIAVTFLVPRLYTNSLFAMLDSVRRHINNDAVDTQDLQPQSSIVFARLTTAPTMRVRNARRTTTNIDTSVSNGTRRNQRVILTTAGSDSESSDGDVEAQKHQLSPGLQDVNLYSPYYSPLEVRKKMNMMFKVQEPEEFGGGSWIGFWRG